MGAIVPAVAELTSIIGAVRTAVNFIENPASLNPFNTQSGLVEKQQELALRQLQAQQKVEAQNAAAQADLQRRQIAASAQEQQDQAQAALMRAVAKQRASFGAQGISPGEGSAQAVLLGLYDQSEEQQADQQRLDNLRYAAIDQNLSNRYNVDVLQRTQLRQKQKLQKIAENY
jgi:hypothetical protein